MLLKQKGVIASYSLTRFLGKIVSYDNEFFFFHKHQFIKGVPSEGAEVAFIISPDPVKRPGHLRTACLIEVTEVVGQSGVDAPSQTVGQTGTHGVQ